MSAESTSAEDMLKQLSVQKVDVLLTDITMPGGMSGYDLALRLRKEMPGIKILALSMNEDGALISRMIDQAGVDGYITKTSGQQELLKAITSINDGENYFSDSILRQYQIYQQISHENRELNLTAREMDIIRCMVKHYSNKQIADELFISERTVETHRKNIYRKTNTKGEASLIQFIKDHKIIS